MIWKTLFVAFLAVATGALAGYEVTEDQRQQFKTVVTQYCKKNGAEDKVSDVEAAATSFVECGKSLFDADTIRKEIEEAKPNGALDEVFKKYCAKSPQLKTCIHTLVDKVAPCLESDLRENVGAINNATDQLLDFVCYKDGDRIALFIAEGGPECFQEKANQLRECANKFKEGLPDVESAKKLSQQEQCAKFDQLSTCVVKALEGCPNPTSGNIAESLFKFVRNGTPCKTN